MNVGVLNVQGAVSEHIATTVRALSELGIVGKVIAIKAPEDLTKIDAFIIPGGESTAIGRLLMTTGIFDVLKKRHAILPIMGTCAGCVLLAKKIVGIDQETLGLMDIEVERNAFGRQRESFEMELDIKKLGAPFHSVFIRAPAITRIWGDVKALAKLDDKIVMARQGELLALSFHPELTDDTRVHKMFLGLVYKRKHYLV